MSAPSSVPGSLSGSTAHSIPEIISLVLPLPSSSLKTLALINKASGATPLYPFTFFPAAIPATCVPCPLTSLALSSPVNTFSTITLPSNII